MSVPVGEVVDPGAERRHLSVVQQIELVLVDDPGVGGWSSGFANQAHWDPERSRSWRCWAQCGPTWSAHCGEQVDASDLLGLCGRHRHQVLVSGDGPVLPVVSSPNQLSAWSDSAGSVNRA